jgi:hypothetical protein
MTSFARNWWKRAQKQLSDDLHDPKAIAREYDVPVKDVERVIEFLARNSRERVDNFKFLLEQLTR